MVASGTSAVMTCAVPRASIPETRPRRAVKIADDVAHVLVRGQTPRPAIIGSSSTGPASRAPSWNAIEAGDLERHSLESTSW